MWHHRRMTDYDPHKMAAALAEMDQLTANFKAAEQALDKARDELRKGIVRNLMERNAPPGQLADHTPYDRNHVGRIAREGGVPPLRETKPKTRKRTAGGKASS